MAMPPQMPRRSAEAHRDPEESEGKSQTNVQGLHGNDSSSPNYIYFHCVQTTSQSYVSSFFSLRQKPTLLQLANKGNYRGSKH